MRDYIDGLDGNIARERNHSHNVRHSVNWNLPSWKLNLKTNWQVINTIITFFSGRPSGESQQLRMDGRRSLRRVWGHLQVLDPLYKTLWKKMSDDSEYFRKFRIGILPPQASLPYKTFTCSGSSPSYLFFIELSRVGNRGWATPSFLSTSLTKGAYIENQLCWVVVLIQNKCSVEYTRCPP